jgi:hypothetical protein
VHVNVSTRATVERKQNHALTRAPGGAPQLWIVVLRYCVGLMAWVTIIALNVLIFGLMLFAYDKAGYLTKAGAVGDVSACTTTTMWPGGGSPGGWTACAAGIACAGFPRCCAVTCRASYAYHLRMRQVLPSSWMSACWLCLATPCIPIGSYCRCCTWIYCTR